MHARFAQHSDDGTVKECADACQGNEAGQGVKMAVFASEREPVIKSVDQASACSRASKRGSAGWCVQQGYEHDENRIMQDGSCPSRGNEFGKLRTH